MDLKSKIILISGPTASGKSKFSIQLAKKIKGEIINADSMQVYKNLNILTARPSQIEMKDINHFLYGYVDGQERYNVEKWCNDAADIIKKNFKNSLTPILVGGTGLYIKTLINGLIDIPPVPEAVKIESGKLIKNFGKDFLINQIKVLLLCYLLHFTSGYTFCYTHEVTSRAMAHKTRCS